MVVRSSLLEEAHAHGPVEAGGIQGITTLAAAPLSHFLAARRRNPVTVEHNLFADLADAWPRAWTCLGAVAEAYGAGGGRRPYRFPPAQVPELPAAEVEAPAADTRNGVVILNGIDPRFDQEIVQRMREAAEPGDAVWLTASLSRISRHLWARLLRAYGTRILQFLFHSCELEPSFVTASYCDGAGPDIGAGVSPRKEVPVNFPVEVKFQLKSAAPSLLQVAHPLRSG